MTRNYFSKKHIGPYFVTDHISESEKQLEDRVEMFLYRVKVNLLSVPRRFWGGIKKISKSL